MAYEKEKYLSYLKDYLSYIGTEIKKDGQMRCPNNSAHNNNDKKNSATFYNNHSTGHPRVVCHACDFDGDIYDVAGHYNNLRDFKDQYKLIDGIYGHPDKTPPPADKKNSKKKGKEEIGEADLIPLSREKAKEIYTISAIDNNRKYAKNDIINKGEIINTWSYTNTDGNIIALDVRFELDKDKIVNTYWYNGKNLKSTGKFNIIYNLYDSIKTKKPILIHEGAKCAKIGNDSLKGLCSVSYNRGVKNAGRPNWNVYKNKPVFILQDNDKPGMDAALKIKCKIPHAIILKSIYNHFEIQDIEKSDIEQLLEQSNSEEISNFILSYDEGKENEAIGKTGPICLGIDDDNRLYFIDRMRRLFDTKRDGLSKPRLLAITPLDYWMENYGNIKGVINWDIAIDDVLEESSILEFDSARVRGRGAWRENGNILYHDGKNTIGSPSGDYMYLRKNKRDIGINDTLVDFKILEKLREYCNDISFATEADIIRLLGWSVISPFCGALYWRPAILMTGESGSGKSTVLEKIVLPLSNAKHYSAQYTSTAGIRADVKNDSCAICLEEAEGGGDTSKNSREKENHRNTLFGIMRASSSEDAADGVKSNSDQQVVKYSMKNMFLFVSITPVISDVADYNRLFKVNFVKPEKKLSLKKWEGVEKALIKLLDKKTTRSIRALVWLKLEKIISDCIMIADVMKYTYKISSRIAAGESILISSYLNIFKETEITKEYVKEYLEAYYNKVEKEEERDEVNEMLILIFDEVIEIDHDRSRKKLTIKECLNCLKNDKYPMFETQNTSPIAKETVRRLSQFGLKLTKSNDLAIANKNKEISRIIGRDHGYNKFFKRHKLFIDEKNVNMSGETKMCVVISIFEDEELKDLVDQIPF